MSCAELSEKLKVLEEKKQEVDGTVMKEREKEIQKEREEWRESRMRWQEEQASLQGIIAEKTTQIERLQAQVVEAVSCSFKHLHGQIFV